MADGSSDAQLLRRSAPGEGARQVGFDLRGQALGIVAAEEGVDPGLARQRQAAGQQDLGAFVIGWRHRGEQIEQSCQAGLEMAVPGGRNDGCRSLIGLGLEQRHAKAAGTGRTEHLDTDVVEAPPLGLPPQSPPATSAGDRLGLEGRMIGELPHRAVRLHSNRIMGNLSHGGMPDD